MFTLCLFRSDLIKAGIQRQGAALAFTVTSTHSWTDTQPTTENSSHKDPGAQEEISSEWIIVCGQFALNESEEDPKYLHINTGDVFSLSETCPIETSFLKGLLEETCT